MKTHFVWLAFFVAIASLLIFQAISLTSSYISKKEDIQLTINALMRKSVDQEVFYRHEMREKKGAKTMNIKESELDSILALPGVIELNEEEMIEAGFLQQMAHFAGHPFDFPRLDSIFRSEMKKAKLTDRFTLCYRDSTGVVLEQTADLTPNQLKRAFRTDSFLIIDGKRVQACVDITLPDVFQKMFGLLVSSFLVLIILFFCVIYLTKTIFTQKKLDKLKTDFTHAFIHNIKNPLGTIQVAVIQIMSDKFDDFGEKKELFGKMALTQVQNLLSRAEQILTVIHLEQGNMIIKFEPTDIKAMVDEIKEKFILTCEKRISISTFVKIESGIEIYLNQLMIKEALCNLIDNAIKYSGESLEIIIDCFVHEETLQLRVIDNGYGISKKDQLKIFEKFERGAAVNRREAKGFGLGLSFVKQVTEAHGGFVSLFSHEGEGSEFTLVLPLKPKE